MSLPAGYRIRPARAADARSIAQVHIQVWLTTYRGLVSDKLLDEMPGELEARVRTWQHRIANPERWHLLVAEAPDGEIVGFCSGGPERRGTPESWAEVGIIYLLMQHQRRGVGSALFRAVARLLKEDGYPGLLVWSLATNPSRAFYETLGGRELERRTEEKRGEERQEVAYGWDAASLGQLVGA